MVKRDEMEKFNNSRDLRIVMWKQWAKPEINIKQFKIQQLQQVTENNVDIVF